MIDWLRRYTEHADPRVAAANFVSLVLAWNQPFYPVYLWFIMGSKAWLEAPDILSALFFATIPAIARRHALLGRAVLPLFAVANVIVVWWMLGNESGIALLLFPCGMLAALLFSWRERWTMLALSLLPLVAWLTVRGRLGPPPIVLSQAELESVMTMNAVSAFALLAFFGWVFLSACPKSRCGESEARKRAARQ